MIRIKLGLSLDGERAWAPADRLGAPTLGPLGFLSLLEAQLGLTREWPSHAERVVQYRDCLKRCDSGNRFYHRTFETDELGTASTLLRWRDLWHLHGWNGSAFTSASPRLRDMGEVEALARDAVSPSVGERLQAVLDVVARRKPPIEEIALVDPIDAFPARWQQVLRFFPVREASSLSSALGQGLLGEVQRAVLAVQRRQRVEPIAWCDDGTVLVHRAETRLLGARWMAERLRTESGDTLVVAGADGSLLDETFVAADRPRHGFRDASEFRPSLQLLPLSMTLLWEPLDCYALLAFLTHPICPVSSFARWRLARKFADQPGMGGEAWQQALSEIDAHYGDRATEVRASIHRWLEHERFPSNGAAPVTSVLDRALSLSEFLRIGLGDEDKALRSAHAAGLTQVSALLNALERLAKQGVAAMPRAQLEQLIAQVTSSASANSLVEAQAGCLLTASDPAAVIEPCATVVWWQLTSPGSIRRYPWSERELAELAQCGVALPSVKQLLAQASEAWTRPIRAAQQRLELVLPPEGEEVHPVWVMLTSFVKDVPVRPLERALVAQDGAAVDAIVHRPLPGRRRWWELPPGVSIPQRASASYSSLNLLLNSPYEWVLRYAAKLRPSDVLAVRDGPLLYGNLVHRLLEKAYGEAGAITLSDDQLERWLDDTLPRVLAEEGAVLLMSGRRADLERFKARVASAMQRLRAYFEAAQVVEALPEMALCGAYTGGQLAGSADLVIRNVRGQRAIVDVKWGDKKSHSKALEDNAHLQLVIYAELLRQQTGAWPAMAYFLVESGRLLARANDFFPSASVVHSRSDETTAQVWQRFLGSWRWRTEQLQAGFVEVAVDGIEPTERSSAPADALAVKESKLEYSDFANLIGWSAES